MPDTTCLDEPVPPPLDDTDNAWSAYKWADHQAGADCRAKLKAVHDVVVQWPRDASHVIKK